MSAIPIYIYKRLLSQIGIHSVFLKLSLPKFVETWSVF